LPVRAALYAIYAAYVALAILYSVATPIFEASDELWHYPMVKHLADNGLALPVQNPAVPTTWRQEGSQPPLYYLIAAVLTSGIDTSDLEYVRRINPHADIGLVRPDGNVNMIVHRDEAFPWQGTVLAVHVARFFSVALGLGTVIVTAQLARALFPNRPTVIVGATALNAFLPMFLFISGSVNNDNASNLLGNLLTLLIVKALTGREGSGIRGIPLYLALGVVTGLGLLAKLNIGFLVPLVALTLLVISLRQKDWRPLVIGGAISGGLTILIAGWWYLRNQQLYSDPTGLNVFLDIVGRRAIPANAAQLWAERHSFTQAFWGFFGGVNVPLPEWVYLIFNVIGGAGMVGAVGYGLIRLQRGLSARRSAAIANALPHLITLAWIAITFISYLRWTSETPASQGRLIFGALSSICVWLALGLTWPLPVRLRPLVMGGVVAFFIGAAALAPFTIITPAYAKPETLQSSEAAAVFQAPNDGAFGLQDARVVSESVQPGGYVELELDWQIERQASRDWSLFVHLLTPGEQVIISQRDVYPGSGTLATSDLAAGYAWRNRIAVPVPPAAYAPMMLDIALGWYHLPTGDRMQTADGEETVIIGSVELQPRPSELDVPNPLSINFGEQIELVGYSLSDLTPAAGELVELTLYWRGLRPVERDYVVFAHILNPTTLTIYAGSDAQPAGWTRPTSTWIPGEIVEDKHTLTVNPDTPPGIYELEIGLYLQEPDGSFPRLRVVTPDGGQADNYAYLSRVRVLPREDTP
jgi:4-amino-4-deoxy-L-arabinose transferase-like glycosyltransferase